MTKIYQLYKKLYNKKIDGRGLAIFRIVFFTILLGEALQLFYYRHLVFDVIPYIQSYEIAIWPVFFFWLPCLILLILGLFTRIASIINYILTVIILGTTSSYEYHMFYSYLIVSFLIIFLPVSRNLSLDRLLISKYKTPNSRRVSVLCYYIPILAGMGFVYFDSVFYKLTSPLWLNGLGMWKPASMPQAAFIDASPILNLKFLALGLGYLTLVFEAIFIFTFWRKSWRTLLLIIGLGLHLGILLCFPIPFFALGVSAIYLLLVPVRFWSLFFENSFISKCTKAITAFFNFLLANRKISTFLSFGEKHLKNQETRESSSFVKKISFISLLVLIAIQVTVSFNSPLWKISRQKIGVEDSEFIQSSEAAIKKMTSLTRDFFGITNHGVFMDSHFADYFHSIAVIYKSTGHEDIWLPITTKKGLPSKYLLGPIWVKWAFRANNPHVNQDVLKKGIRDFTAFWAYKHQIDLNNAEFQIKVKKNKVPYKWERDFLKNQLKNPWIDAGTVKWENLKFKANLKIIENI